MNRAVIIHGIFSKKEYFERAADSPSNSHWFPWLQQQLLRRGLLAQTPEMPSPYEPDYDKWKKELDRLSPDNNTLLVGHSCGGGFLIRWLCENPEINVGKVVLVAPWLDVEKRLENFFDFNINKNIDRQTKFGIKVIYSNNDMPEIKSSVDKLRKETTSLIYYEFDNFGHFTFNDMKTHEFPELMKICLGD
ncbi:MAG TPA: alpha/beta hydrolase [Candidatus Saccharibacteria bacterium]|nr:alpha/beta hydrolase [Candidatus Saccharibacteria bacterium]